MSTTTTEQQSLSIQEALTRLSQLITQPPKIEPKLPLQQALGRVLAQNIISPINVPGHNNSAMDGYAFSSHILQSNAEWIELTITGQALAGQSWQGAPAPDPHQCIQITTGAVMPDCYDTVIPVEFVEKSDTTIRFNRRAIRPKDNYRKAGEDLTQGATALTQGSLLTPAALGLLASLGIQHIPVYRPLRVAYFSTGDEILNLGDTQRQGTIFDANRYTILAMLTRLGVQAIDLGLIPDQPQALQAAFSHASQIADAIITSGGVSIGSADHTKTVMRQLGDVQFWRIAMRPGRPMAVGRINNVILFGLPGNPVAVMVTFLALVRPTLLQMMGANHSAPPLLQAKTQEAIPKKTGRTEYQRGIVQTNANGELTVRITGNQGSGILSSMVQANGLIVLDHNQGDVAAGQTVNVMMFEGAM